MAEFERDVIRERTKAGLQAARARGRLGGLPRLLAPGRTVRSKKLYDARKNTVIEICKFFNISRPTFYNYLKAKADYAACEVLDLAQKQELQRLIGFL